MSPTDAELGAAYVFERSDDNWIQRAKLVADDGDVYDRFGSSAALDGDGTTALVDAYDDEDPNGRHAGSAYVFERAGGSWNQQTKLAANDGGFAHTFGTEVMLSDDGSTAFVSATGDSVPGREDAGSTYVFERISGGKWKQRAKLIAENSDDSGLDRFGHSLDITDDGGAVLIGAPFRPDSQADDAAYIFERDGGST